MEVWVSSNSREEGGEMPYNFGDCPVTDPSTINDASYPDDRWYVAYENWQ